MIYEFYEKYKKTILIISGLIAIFMLFFYGISSYVLIDVDETRYVAIAREMLERKNWLAPYFNGEYFFEKPPLYFWMLMLSFKFFGFVSEFSARIFIVLTSLFGVLYTYILVRKIISHRVAVIASAILSTSFFYLLLSHIAIIDIVLSVFIMSSIFSGFLTLYVQDKNKKYFWWLAYMFSGLAVLAKGIPGVALPSMILFFIFLITKNLKELFKPINIIPGIVIFLLFTLPWHIAMLKMYGRLFFDTYVIKHHIARFLDSENLGRKQPFLFYVPVIFTAVFPWSFVLVAYIVKAIKSIGTKIKNNIFNTFIDKSMNFDSITVFCWIYIGVTFIFFSTASTKLPTYILPMLAPLSILMGIYWYQYLYENKNNKGISKANTIFAVFLVLAAIGLLIAPAYLKDFLSLQIKQLNVFVVPFLLLFSGLFLYFTKNKERETVFCLYIVFMIFTIYVCVKDVTKIVVNSGENQLIEYAQFVKRMSDAKLFTYDFGVRPSVAYYFGKKVQFFSEVNDSVKENLKNELSSNQPIYVIIKNSNYNSDFEDVKVIKSGSKYTLLSN